MWSLSQAEVVLPDSPRCDCLTKTHAIEFDFGPVTLVPKSWLSRASKQCGAIDANNND